jgi:lysophospholipase L1-like esterase
MRTRRLFYWYLPLALAVACSITFALGFSMLYRDDLGVTVAEPVTRLEQRKDEAGPLKIVLLGDSVARGTGDESGEGIGGYVEKVLEERKIAHEDPLNLAVNGARTHDLLKQIDESPSVRGFIANADVVVVSIGGNDLWGDRSIRTSDEPPDPEEAMNRIEERVVEVLRRVRAINPEGRIFYVGLYNPFREGNAKFGELVDIAVAEWQARLVRQFSDDSNLTIVQTYDLFSHNDRLSADRFHPGAEGYRLIGRRSGEAI